MLANEVEANLTFIDGASVDFGDAQEHYLGLIEATLSKIEFG